MSPYFARSVRKSRAPEPTFEVVAAVGVSEAANSYLTFVEPVIGWRSGLNRGHARHDGERRRTRTEVRVSMNGKLQTARKLLIELWEAYRGIPRHDRERVAGVLRDHAAKIVRPSVCRPTLRGR